MLGPHRLLNRPNFVDVHCKEKMQSSIHILSARKWHCCDLILDKKRKDVQGVDYK